MDYIHFTLLINNDKLKTDLRINIICNINWGNLICYN